MDTRKSSDNISKQSDWLVIDGLKDIYIHKKLFKEGIVAASSEDTNSEIKKLSFPVKPPKKPECDLICIPDNFTKNDIASLPGKLDYAYLINKSIIYFYDRNKGALTQLPINKPDEYASWASRPSFRNDGQDNLLVTDKLNSDILETITRFTDNSLPSNNRNRVLCISYDWHDLILLSLQHNDTINLNDLRTISKKNNKKPILINQDGVISIYGFSDDAWKCTSLDSTVFKNIKFPAPATTAHLKACDITKEMRQAITAKQGHTPFAHKADNGAIKSANDLLKKLNAFSKKQAPATSNNLLIFNKNRHDEVFLPLFSADNTGEASAAFVYPWLAKKDSNMEFTGFSQFVTVGCIFGSALKGTDNNENTFELIKHDIKFYNEQAITKITTSKELSPYEIMLFHELKKLAHIIDRFSDPAKPKQLHYHLPYYDYMLFAVQLYIHNRMTMSGLNEFIGATLKRRAEHIKQITSICNSHNINVTISSPFENLIGYLEPCNIYLLDNLSSLKVNDEYLKNNYILTKDYQLFFIDSLGNTSQAIELSDDLQSRLRDTCVRVGKNANKNPQPLTTLISPNVLKDIDSHITKYGYRSILPAIDTNQIQNPALAQQLLKILGVTTSTHFQNVDQDGEKKLVASWLAKLTHNKFNPQQAQVWSDFLNDNHRDDIENIEDMLKIANTVMPAVASYGKEDYKTCSLLSLSEKQVQVNYKTQHDKLSASNSSKPSYPKLIYITVLESLFTYDSKTDGLPFYFAGFSSKDLSKLLTKRNLLSIASSNISLFSQRGTNKAKPIKLQDAVKDNQQIVISDVTETRTPK